ncbi:FAD-dependent oxidoreductase [Xanthobacter autotrophicus]|uniref:NAD(P)/FAD-dependent oxidoreductase n=1 Tax=Xanthobacter autotrophicus TaxID=280 RepID=UPI0037296D46
MTSFDVVILGAGYGGLTCAVRLAGRTKKLRLRIALVGKSASFQERLRLHEGLADPGFGLPVRLPALAEFLAGSGCTFIQGEVREIDRAERCVRLHAPDGEHVLSYGQLVIALGSRTVPEPPGADQHAYVLDAEGPRAQPELKRRLASLDVSAPRIVVVGGSATGIEVAAELVRLRGAGVTILERGTFAGFATPAVKRRLVEAVNRAGIVVREHVRVEAVEPDRVVTSAGDMPCDVCVWCAGFSGQPVAPAAGFETDAAGRIRVDPWLRALGDPFVFAAGDASIPIERCGAPPRMSAFFALATGAHVADTIARMHAGKRPRPFGFWTWGQAIGVGEEAVGFATMPHDRQIGPIYGGRMAFLLRAFFIRLLVRLIGLHRRFPALPFWLGRGAYRDEAIGRYAPPVLTPLHRRDEARS